MIDNTLNTVLSQVIPQLNGDNIFIQNSRKKEAKIWWDCANCIMLDHLTFARKLRMMNDSLSSFMDLSVKEIDRYVLDVQNLTKGVLKPTVQPSRVIRGANNKRRRKEIDNLILLFWRIPQLLPYAPIMSILALIKGVPNEIWNNYIPDEVLDNMDETEINGRDFCDGMKIIIQEWKKSNPDYRSKRYRDHKPHFNDETLTQDFWMMILFMQLQLGLANYITNEGRVSSLTTGDLNSFYSDFLSIWPYSPELFFNVEIKQSHAVPDWRSILSLLSNDIENYYELKKNLNRIRKLDDKDKKVIKLLKLNLTGDNRSAQNLKKNEFRWLVPWTPHFAAYYFIDDFNLYGMLHCKDNEDGYRKRILNILLEERRGIDRINESEELLSANSGMKIPIRLNKTEHFDRIESGTCSEGTIRRAINPVYWSFLLGSYEYLTIEKTRKGTETTTLDLPGKEFCERPATRRSRRMRYGRITIPPLRIVKDLELEEISREAQDTDENL